MPEEEQQGSLYDVRARLHAVLLASHALHLARKGMERDAGRCVHGLLVGAGSAA